MIIIKERKTKINAPGHKIVKFFLEKILMDHGYAFIFRLGREKFLENIHIR